MVKKLFKIELSPGKIDLPPPGLIGLRNIVGDFFRNCSNYRKIRIIQIRIIESQESTVSSSFTKYIWIAIEFFRKRFYTSTPSPGPIRFLLAFLFKFQIKIVGKLIYSGNEVKCLLPKSPKSTETLGTM